MAGESNSLYLKLVWVVGEPAAAQEATMVECVVCTAHGCAPQNGKPRVTRGQLHVLHTVTLLNTHLWHWQGPLLRGLVACCTVLCVCRLVIQCQLKLLASNFHC